MWKDSNWYIDQRKMLVVEAEEEERAFIILDMKRLYHKSIDDEVDTWWAFNSKQIILRESKFDLHNVTN